MKAILILLFITAFAREICNSQVPVHKDFGTVRVSISSLPFKDILLTQAREHYRIFLTSKDFYREVIYKGKTLKKNKDDYEYHDNYELKIPVGIYRLIIDTHEDYKMANFMVNPNELVEFQIPQARFGFDEVCEDSVRVLKILFSHESLIARDKRYRKSNPILTDVFSLQPPFEAAIEYCDKKVIGKVVEYKTARIYYKNYYIAADRLNINKDNFNLSAKGSNNNSVLVQINGGEFKAVDKLFLNFSQK